MNPALQRKSRPGGGGSVLGSVVSGGVEQKLVYTRQPERKPAAKGGIHLHDGQWFVEVERKLHRRRDGILTTLIVWRSQCCECGSYFTFTAPALASKFQPNRRCAMHHQPGVPVRGCA